MSIGRRQDMKIREREDDFFQGIISLITLLSASLLLFIVGFIAKESAPIVDVTSIKDFLTGSDWNPLSRPPVLSIAPMIAGTLYVSSVAIAIAVPFAVGTSLWLSCFATETARRVVLPLLDMLAGIPSVVFGFFGLMVIVPWFERNMGLSSGESILAGSIVLAMMILPYIVAMCTEQMASVREKHLKASMALGVDPAFMALHMVLPASIKSVGVAVLVALARAMGETMAVMMVTGNSPIWPKLLGRSHTIPALIALEMGGATAGSPHSAALYGSGMVLMAMLLAISSLSWAIRRKRRWIE